MCLHRPYRGLKLPQKWFVVNNLMTSSKLLHIISHLDLIIRSFDNFKMWLRSQKWVTTMRNYPMKMLLYFSKNSLHKCWCKKNINKKQTEISIIIRNNILLFKKRNYIYLLKYILLYSVYFCKDIFTMATRILATLTPSLFF